MSLISYDIGIQDNYDNTTVYEYLIPQKQVSNNHENKVAKLYDLYYTPSVGAEKLPYLTYPLHLTVKNELESEGLEIVACEKEMIENETLITFEIAATDKDLENIEYNIIKKYSLNNKNITLTIY